MAGNGISPLWLLLAGVGGFVASSFWDSYPMGMLATGVLLNAGATSTLWQRVVRRPEKLKKKFRKRLWESKPITPNGRSPRARSSLRCR